MNKNMRVPHIISVVSYKLILTEFPEANHGLMNLLAEREYRVPGSLTRAKPMASLLCQAGVTTDRDLLGLINWLNR